MRKHLIFLAVAAFVLPASASSVDPMNSFHVDTLKIIAADLCTSVSGVNAKEVINGGKPTGLLKGVMKGKSLDDLVASVQFSKNGCSAGSDCALQARAFSSTLVSSLRDTGKPQALYEFLNLKAPTQCQ